MDKELWILVGCIVFILILVGASGYYTTTRDNTIKQECIEMGGVSQRSYKDPIQCWDVEKGVRIFTPTELEHLNGN